MKSYVLIAVNPLMSFACKAQGHALPNNSKGEIEFNKTVQINYKRYS